MVKVSQLFFKRQNFKMSLLKKIWLWFFHLHQTQLGCINIVLILINILIAVAKLANDSLKMSSAASKKSAPFHNKKFLETRTVNTFSNDVDFPMETFIVSIHAPTEYAMIGSGAIVSKYWALTTAFCAELIKKHPIHTVKFRGNVIMHRFGFFHELDRIVIHPEYNANSIAYNVAVVKVTDPFVFENEVRIKIIPELYKENKLDNILLWAFAEGNSALIKLNLSKESVVFDNQLNSVKIANNEINFCKFLPGVMLAYKDWLLGSIHCLKYETNNCTCTLSYLYGLQDWIHKLIPE